MNGVIRTVSALLAALAVFALAGCSRTTGKRNTGNGKTVNDVISEKTESETESSTEAETPVSSETETEKPFPDVKNGDVDVDLTTLTSTMVYAQVNDMLTYPANYTDKKVRMKGQFAVAAGDGRYYFAVIISDATACCSQGIEFVLADGRSYPDEYPEPGTEITVTGYYHTYSEGPVSYPELYDAVME